MICRLVVLFLATASAFQLPSMSRRDFARALAAAPLGVAGAAFADADNLYLGVGKSGLGAGNVDKFGAPTKAIGREGALVDTAGSAVPPKIAYGTTKDTANFKDEIRRRRTRRHRRRQHLRLHGRG